MLWYLPALLVAFAGIFGPLGANQGWLTPEAGWQLFFAGFGLAFLSMFGLAAAAAFASATGRAWRGRAVRGALVPLLMVVGVLVANRGHLGNPLIHDVTTDAEDTLRFPPDVASRPERMSREEVLALQRESYPDLETLTLSIEPDRAFERAETAAAGLPRWEVVGRDPAAGIVEARVRSTIFRFVDDIVIRVRPTDDGESSRIDVRSRSRYGEGDFGANAAHVRALLDVLADTEE